MTVSRRYFHMTVSKKKKLLLVSILVTTLSLVFLVLSAQSILAYMKDIKAISNSYTTVQKYAVTFDANGGQGSMPTQYMFYGVKSKYVYKDRYDISWMEH